MAAYKVQVDARVTKIFRKLPKKHALQIKKAIERLGVNPRPQDCIKLEGSNGFRVTVGEYRLLYTINDESKLVQIYVIGKRNDDEVYK